MEIVQTAARVVDGWAGHFMQHGFCAADLELLAGSIDRDSLGLLPKENFAESVVNFH